MRPAREAVSKWRHPLGMDPAEVAVLAVRALSRNRRVAVPGRPMRALLAAIRVVPQSFRRERSPSSSSERAELSSRGGPARGLARVEVRTDLTQSLLIKDFTSLSLYLKFGHSAGS